MDIKKRVFIIHGWDGYPEEGWFPWLKKELEQRGFEVFVPAMPNPDEPKIEEWIPFFANIIGQPDENTYFVGHSIGCQTIIRYLEKIDKKIGGVIFVAGWFTLMNLKTEEEVEIAKSWLETPVDFDRVKVVTNNFVAIFSDNDPMVPFEENKKLFETRFNAKIIIEHNKGHFNGSDGVTELPVVLDSILNL